MKSCLVRPTLDFKPFNTQFPPYSEEQKKQILGALPYAGTTQAACCKTVSWFCTFIVLIVAVACAWNPISNSIVHAQTAGLARQVPVVGLEDLMK